MSAENIQENNTKREHDPPSITDQKQASFPTVADQPNPSVECSGNARRKLIEAALQVWVWHGGPRFALASYGDRIDESRVSDADVPFAVLLSRTLLTMAVNSPPEKRRDVHDDNGRQLMCVAPRHLVAHTVRCRPTGRFSGQQRESALAEVAQTVAMIMAKIKRLSSAHAAVLEDHARAGVQLLLVRPRARQLDKQLRSRTASRRLGSGRALAVRELALLNRRKEELEARRRGNRHNRLYDEGLVLFERMASKRADVRRAVFGTMVTANSIKLPAVVNGRKQVSPRGDGLQHRA
jgi:hypothetical protein